MTVAEWVDRYYKPDRLNRPGGTREHIIANREREVERDGTTLISRHDSVTGQAEWYPRAT